MHVATACDNVAAANGATVIKVRPRSIATRLTTASATAYTAGVRVGGGALHVAQFTRDRSVRLTYPTGATARDVGRAQPCARRRPTVEHLASRPSVVANLNRARARRPRPDRPVDLDAHMRRHLDRNSVIPPAKHYTTSPVRPDVCDRRQDGTRSMKTTLCGPPTDCLGSFIGPATASSVYIGRHRDDQR